MLFKATAVNGTPVALVFSSIDGFGETGGSRIGKEHGMIFVGPRTIETRESHAELLSAYASVAAAQARY